MSVLEYRNSQCKGSGVTGRPSPRNEPGIQDGDPAEALVAGLAHNLRNLIQVVNGNLELIAARADDELTLRYLANAQTAAQLIAELARNIEEDLSE
jgi:two-component sensor histidine kinase